MRHGVRTPPGDVDRYGLIAELELRGRRGLGLVPAQPDMMSAADANAATVATVRRAVVPSSWFSYWCVGSVMGDVLRCGQAAQPGRIASPSCADVGDYCALCRRDAPQEESLADQEDRGRSGAARPRSSRTWRPRSVPASESTNARERERRRVDVGLGAGRSAAERSRSTSR